MNRYIMILSLTTSAFAQEAPKKPHPFFDRTNIALFSADFLTRTMDAQSTRMKLTDPCKCFVEENTPTVSARTSTQYAYSLGVAGGVMGLSWVAHKTGHHKIERILPLL